MRAVTAAFVFVCLVFASGCTPEGKGTATGSGSYSLGTKVEDGTPSVFFPAEDATILAGKNLAGAQAKYSGNRYRAKIKYFGVKQDIPAKNGLATILLLFDTEKEIPLIAHMLTDMKKAEAKIFEKGHANQNLIFDITVNDFKEINRETVVVVTFNGIIK